MTTQSAQAAADLAERIDAELDAAQADQDTAIALVKDDPWCRKALTRRGIEVPA